MYQSLYCPLPCGFKGLKVICNTLNDSDYSFFGTMQKQLDYGINNHKYFLMEYIFRDHSFPLHARTWLCHRAAPGLRPIKSTKFCKIPQKCGNSVENDKFCGPAWNSAAHRKLWFLYLLHNAICILCRGMNSLWYTSPYTQYGSSIKVVQTQ